MIPESHKHFSSSVFYQQISSTVTFEVCQTDIFAKAFHSIKMPLAFTAVVWPLLTYSLQLDSSSADTREVALISASTNLGGVTALSIG